MNSLLSVPMIIALASFLWYRKGRIWHFYDSLVTKSVKQITQNSLDRKRWEEIALKQCDVLSGETFHGLFRTEVEYLRNKILDNQHQLWISDGSATSEERIEYTDKEKYACYVLKNMFYSELRFCGLLLLINAIKYRLSRPKDEDPGVRKT